MKNSSANDRARKDEPEGSLGEMIRPGDTPPVDRIDERALEQGGTQTVDGGMGMQGDMMLNARLNKAGTRGGVTDSEMMGDADAGGPRQSDSK